MTDLDADGYWAALTQMRLVLLASGAFTLSEVDRHAPALTRTVLSAYVEVSTGEAVAPLPPPPLAPPSLWSRHSSAT